jgi:hypothetical protein
MRAMPAVLDSCLFIAPIGAPKSTHRSIFDKLTQTVVEPVVRTAGLTLQEPHLITEPGSISDQVVSALLDDRLVIADLTGLNPNVVYELAVRHTTVLQTVTFALQGTDVSTLAPDTLTYVTGEQGRALLRERLSKDVAIALKERLRARHLHWNVERARHRHVSGPPGEYPAGERESLTFHVRNEDDANALSRLIDDVVHRPKHGYVVLTVRRDFRRTVAFTGLTTASALAEIARSTYGLSIDAESPDTTLARQPLTLRNSCVFLSGAPGRDTGSASGDEPAIDDIANAVARELGMTAEAFSVPIAQTGRRALDNVLAAVCAGRLLIADITGLPPIVMYALAVGHAAWLPVILIAKDGTINPFDIGSQRTFYYETEREGSDSLRRWLRDTAVRALAMGSGSNNPVVEASRAQYRSGIAIDRVDRGDRSTVTFRVRRPEDEDAIANVAETLASSRTPHKDVSDLVMVTEATADGRWTIAWTPGITRQSLVVLAREQYGLSVADNV